MSWRDILAHVVLTALVLVFLGYLATLVANAVASF